MTKGGNIKNVFHHLKQKHEGSEESQKKNPQGELDSYSEVQTKKC